MGVALLDVSKCYERVTHEVAGRRPVESGCSPVIVNMATSMCQCKRRLLVDGAVSAPLQGARG